MLSSIGNTDDTQSKSDGIKELEAILEQIDKDFEAMEPQEDFTKISKDEQEALKVLSSLPQEQLDRIWSLLRPSTHFKFEDGKIERIQVSHERLLPTLDEVDRFIAKEKQEEQELKWEQSGYVGPMPVLPLTDFDHAKEAVYTHIKQDPYLKPYKQIMLARQRHFLDTLAKIDHQYGGMNKFSLAYQWMGLHPMTVSDPKEPTKQMLLGIQCLEWIPGAQKVSLIGDFNNWNVEADPLTPSIMWALENLPNNISEDETFDHAFKSNSFWSCFVPCDGVDAPLDPQPMPIQHGSRVKLAIQMEDGQWVHRNSPWARRCIQQESRGLFEAVFWFDQDPENIRLTFEDMAAIKATHYMWRHPRTLKRPSSLRIYEVHIGICTSEGRVSTFRDFIDTGLIERISDLGYNAIQLMAIQEHAYYASFGYQVTGFYAPSSRFGTPNELKELIDKAHGLGMLVLLDLVHSHASSNTLDGLNQFDRSFFKPIKHPLWDSQLFDYGRFEVLQFLVSNVRYWLEEFRFDGFRFDGITSMLYDHHGANHSFTGHYDEYFGALSGVNGDALCYLQLVNHLLHDALPMEYPRQYPEHSLPVTIAEDVSGMPGMCKSVLQEAGVGFDYRLAMAGPDLWIKILKECRDEQWPIGHICHVFTNRRKSEPVIAYSESHDQALVGDKTIAFWLMDAEMYTHMTRLAPLSPIIDRGMALHKLIRLITFALGGESWLCFMGNEFGHPEWLDFPREGNGWSYHYARRQYNLCDDPLLRYQGLARFDRAMMHLDKEYNLLASPQAHIITCSDQDKLFVFERSGLIFAFNFHPVHSYDSLRIQLSDKMKQGPGMQFKAVLDSDALEYEGHARIQADCLYPVSDVTNESPHFKVYLPSRTALVYCHTQKD